MNLDSKLREYTGLLRDWHGLVGRGEEPDALVEDSLGLLPHLGGARSVVDVGAGGGMPGIPLKLADPGLAVALLEADHRKTAFLIHAAARLGIEVEVIGERAETAGHGPLRERFDAAVCRALAPLPVAAELCLPLVTVGGRLLAMTAGTDHRPAQTAFSLLGGGEPLVRAAPTGARRQGTIVIVEKLASTPPAYPRRPGVPARRPLGI